MKFQVYKDKAGEWRWHFKADNGQVIADSSEGYKNKVDCINMIHSLLNYAADHPYPIIEEIE